MSSTDPDHSTSMLDLLLSGLGAVAVLMVLFAAIRTLNARQGGAPAVQAIAIEIKSGPEHLLLGEHLGVAVHYGSSVLLFNGSGPSEETPDGAWLTRFPQKKVVVRLAPGQPVAKVVVWVRRPAAAPGTPSSDAAAQLANMLALATQDKPIEVSIYPVRTQPDSAAPSVVLKLRGAMLAETTVSMPEGT
jgi:hypothetical protein